MKKTLTCKTCGKKEVKEVNVNRYGSYSVGGVSIDIKRWKCDPCNRDELRGILERLKERYPEDETHRG